MKNAPSFSMGVEGHTRVLTQKGYTPIRDLVGSGWEGSLKVWNGHEFVDASPFESGRNQQMTCIHFSDGNQLICTLNWAFILADGSMAKAGDLRKGSVLAPYSLPVNRVEGPINVPSLDNCRFGHWFPSAGDSLKTRMYWLNSILEYQAFVQSNINTDGCTIWVEKRENLYQAQAVLHSLGCFCRIFKDGHSRSIFGLDIPPSELSKLLELGLKMDNVTAETIGETASFSIYVDDISPYHKCRSVYAFEEKCCHQAVLNGILVASCAGRVNSCI